MKGKSSVKIPAGKHVKVEVENSDGIENVEVRGDFFLEPPEALEKIEEELEKLDKEADKQTVLNALKNIEADFIGFSRDDLSEAFLDALEKTRWRIIDEGKYNEAMHHALDQVLTEKMEKREIPPTLRFWYRENKAVPLGRFQSIEDEVELEYAEENNIEVVRRNTGGGAMYAEPGDVITYSLHIPKDMVPDDVQESYKELDKWAVNALQSLGLEVDYEPLNDIKHPEGKVGGAAQLRKNNSVLHHTMISYDLNTENMLKALRIGKEKVSDKAIKSAEERVAVINDFIDQSREEIIETLKEKFKYKYGGLESSLTDEEIEEARKIAEKKFSSTDWNKKL